MDNPEEAVIPSLLSSGAQGNTDPSEMEHELHDFRSQWRQELSTRSPRGAEPAKDLQRDSYILEQAKVLFMKGSQLEQSGQLYEAVAFYKRATQLVPDIEFHIDFTSFHNSRERQESESSIGSIDNEELEENLVDYFQNLQLSEDSDNQKFCSPEFQQRVTHISVLPVELLNYVLRWVVSVDLDMKSLENFSLVCRGFYLAARDEGIWRSACQKVWGASTGKCKKYGGWRNMFIQRPHLLFNGCYISKLSYVRPGEKSLDNFYRPYHLVEYYRYARFFPEGIIMIFTSPDDPHSVLPKLQLKSAKDTGMLKGMYKLTGDTVTAVLKRVKTKDQSIPYYKKQQRQRNQNDMEMTYHVELELCNMGRKSSAKLQWVKYAVTTKYLMTGQENTCALLDNKGFPPLLFSRVKSYTSSSETPLL
ncbi:F-box only protein 9-like [Ostrea edulis]|uniref:F-box only protein 9-like n=1 Tax=Ostrea edulis TaxID=37623 RepID=UPI002095045E|nr:F-box only protein 9-like [Ostrea edulis]